jgi:hypothetical protein
MWHANRGRDMHTIFGWENQKGRNHMEDPGIYERKILQLI